MTQPLLILGLPRALARDGWWLDASPPNTAESAIDVHSRLPRWAGLVVLVALSDWLFWHESPGLSLALFAVAILVVASAGSFCAMRQNMARAMWRLPQVLAKPV